MAPSVGTRVGPYRLGPELGRGASGVVYEATDEKLGRKVALKVLSEDVARTPEQRERFAREARLLAAVRHPNVAVVYGVVEQDGRVWLALEHLGGETLADALARGPLPIEEALDVARQVADGLEAAHECGVVHRDLKPANVKREPDGTVKVLDFGLAKPVREELADASDLTSEGLALGTPLYMSPEQLRGRPVDRRADVWALGCVLWELLTGRRTFEAETGADVLHAILDRDPDPERLPRATPTRVRELLARCLQKDPRRRLRDAGDARLELETALAERAWARPAAGEPSERSGARPGWLAAGALAVAAGLLGAWLARGPLASEGASAPERRVLRLALDVPPGDKQTYPRVSPDGSTIVHELAGTSRARPGERRLVARRLDSFDDVPIPGTERVDTFSFSPDGERLAVVRVSEGSAGRFELSVVHVDGSRPPRFLGTLPESLSTTGSVAWLDDGRVVLSTRPRGLLLLATDGSGRADEVAVRCDEDVWPHAPDVLEALPGRNAVLASSFQLSGRGASDCIVALDVDTGEQTLLVEGSRHAAWQRDGWLLFSRSDVLLVAPFDVDTLAIGGDPIPIASGLRAEEIWMSGTFHASREGTVAWWPGGVQGDQRRLCWVTGVERPSPWSDDSFALQGFLEVDETASFLTAVVVGPAGNYELWGSEIADPRLRPLRADPRYDWMGGCVDLGRRELIECRFGPQGGEVRRTSLDRPGEGELLLGDATEGRSFSSPALHDDGRLLTVYQSRPSGAVLMALDLSATAPQEPWIVFEASPSTRHMRVAPDGRWLLVTERAGPVSVRRLDEEGQPGPPVVVPAPGLEAPGASWARGFAGEGYRLHLMPTGSDSVYEVEMVETQDGLELSAPRLVLRLDEGTFYDAVHVDGDRYLGIVTDPSELTRDRIHVLVGATDALSRP